MATRLHYLGDGSEWIFGAPSADFETDDEALVAECLACGLYEVEADVPRGKTTKKQPADPAEGN